MSGSGCQVSDGLRQATRLLGPFDAGVGCSYNEKHPHPDNLEYGVVMCLRRWRKALDFDYLAVSRAASQIAAQHKSEKIRAKFPEKSKESKAVP